MPPSQARTLTDAHRKAQLALRSQTMRDVLKVWPAFDVNRIRATWGPLEEALLLLVAHRAQTAGGLATSYYQRLRRASGIATPTALKVATVDVDKVVAGLRIVGPINAAKQLSLGRQAEDVMRATLVNVSGETTRHVQNVGRQTVTESVKADRQAIGYQRVIGGEGCDFCQALASEGTIYKSDSIDFAAHRNCGCYPEPAFR